MLSAADGVTQRAENPKDQADDDEDHSQGPEERDL
jgi:hypothetical protein